MGMARHYRGDEDTEATQQIYAMPADKPAPRQLSHEPYVPMHQPTMADTRQQDVIARLQKLVGDLDHKTRTVQGQYADLVDRLQVMEDTTTKFHRLITATYVGFGFLVTLLVLALVISL